MEAKTSEVRNCLCLQSRRAARHLTQIYDQALRPCGLRVTQFQLLAAVNEAQPVTQQTLSAVIGMDRTTLTRNLALLKRGGLIQIEAGRDDHRERVHRLTAAGRRAVTEAFPLWRSAQESVVEQLSAGPGQPSRAVISRLLGVLGDLPIDFSVNS